MLICFKKISKRPEKPILFIFKVILKIKYIQKISKLTQHYQFTLLMKEQNYKKP